MSLLDITNNCEAFCNEGWSNLMFKKTMGSLKRALNDKVDKYKPWGPNTNKVWFLAYMDFRSPFRFVFLNNLWSSCILLLFQNFVNTFDVVDMDIWYCVITNKLCIE